MGRDFFDIMFLVQNTKPDALFLENKVGTSKIDQIKAIIQRHLADANFELLANDVHSFLQNHHDADKIKLFPQFINQQL